MHTPRGYAARCTALVVLAGGLGAFAQHEHGEEHEKKIQEAQVPKTALEALQKLADKATIIEFAEETEHGQKYYEATWKGPDGIIDALVTGSGDWVEMEEAITADKVPAAVRAAAEKKAGKDAKITYERKTLILYEIHFEKGNQEREEIFTPDGGSYHSHTHGEADDQ